MVCYRAEKLATDLLFWWQDLNACCMLLTYLDVVLTMIMLVLLPSGLTRTTKRRSCIGKEVGAVSKAALVNTVRHRHGNSCQNVGLHRLFTCAVRASWEPVARAMRVAWLWLHGHVFWLGLMVAVHTKMQDVW